jgi:hypothetical protein
LEVVISVPLLDLNVKFVIDHTLRTVRNDPDRHIKEIFGDARLEPNAALYGNRMIQDVKDWITKTEIPVLLGFDLDPAQIPGVTINLESSAPNQQFMGDFGGTFTENLQPHEKEVIVERFSPKNVVLSATSDFYTITLPDSLSDEQTELVLPGLRWRDKNGKEYGIGDDKNKPTAFQVDKPGFPAISVGDFSSLEVIAPFDDALYREGAMYYDENALVTIHGHSDRNEGLWLWAIVHWGLLKFRPLLTATFGLDLAIPRASDFAKADEFLGTNVWRRFITLGARAVWSWQAARQRDVAAFILTIKGSQTNSDEETDL